MSAGAALPSVGATTAKAASAGTGPGGGGGYALLAPLLDPGLNADAEEAPGAGAAAVVSAGARYSGTILAPKSRSMLTSVAEARWKPCLKRRMSFISSSAAPSRVFG